MTSSTDDHARVAEQMRSQEQDYHARGYERPERQWVAMANFAWRSEAFREPSGARTALDAACGAGAATEYLRSTLPGLTWTGLDRDERLIAQARYRCPGAAFTTQDLRSLSIAHDVTFCLSTLSFIPSYEQVLGRLIHYTRRSLFLSSIFWDGDEDVRSLAVMQWGETKHYNALSWPRFTDLCMMLGARAVRSEPFLIDETLENPHTRMGTYTVGDRAGEGYRMASGPLLMPWRLVEVVRD